MADAMARDYTPTGLKIEGSWENDRNVTSRDLFKAIIREVFGVEDVIIGNHLTYSKTDTRPDGFNYEVVEEIPSADTLIFDHDVARKLWGEDRYLSVLAQLAACPCETRDALLAQMYASREQWG